ncbi:SDR family oxidoreductase [Mangrovimicrobium sediminis]|uniref:SDR family oxidoreductase n=1 Tax=Mangrovimicrobium sediminis TaxID=2562682 RepID=A0A4Z0LW49_9GAMM|nr:SDR family NAD(P)-dependent oxidoreductase [Haliea sp. SAOS-164]TGD71376.1 SDR family oxidoreductase [Haliea sp. SAOS-164]
MSLNGKIAVVTGGGSGIGRAISLKLAADGAAVAVWDLNPEGAQETVEMITAAGGKALACVGNAADAATIASSAALTRETFGGPITILVNNAGITGFTPFLDITEDHWDRMMAINLKGPFLCCQQIVPDMLEAGWGRIVNISSSSAQTGAMVMTHYSASKGGVIAFTKSLAKEFAAKGITVNNIPPGFVDTPMLRASPVNVDAEASSGNSPMGRPGVPEDIANACAFLVSEAAGYITGHTLGVNGGRVMP